MVSILFSYTLRAVCFASIVTFLYGIWAYMRKKERKMMVIEGCFLFYLSALIHITCIRYGIDGERMMHHSMAQIQLLPFVDIIALFHEGFLSLLLMVGGNILWFMPLGVYVYWKYPSQIQKACIFGFLTSLCIETMQFILVSGVSDVDDLLLNTLGCMLGFYLSKKWQEKNINSDEDVCV